MIKLDCVPTKPKSRGTTTVKCTHNRAAKSDICHISMMMIINHKNSFY